MQDEYAVKMDVEKQLVKVQKSEKSIMAKVKDLGEEMRGINTSTVFMHACYMYYCYNYLFL